MIADLKRMVETAGKLIGDIPYEHYAFLMMGSGAGGIEHSNSSANAFGAMLDLKIREASGNRSSLDDVMRGLYRKYYQEKKRGFTEAEFREECEAAAGRPLTEVLEYASTTKDVDYAKYFAYAGLKVTMTSESAPGSYIGLNTQIQDGKFVVVSTTGGSPSQAAGLTVKDQILEVDGTAATPKALNDMLTVKKPGDRARLKILRDNTSQEIEIVLVENMKRSFQIQPMPNPSAMQSAILEDWLRSVQ